MKKVWRRLENLVFVLILFLITLYFILQLPSVQNWIALKATRYLSQELKTEVRIGRIDIQFFDNLVLEQLFVADQRGDTLLYAGELIAGLNTSIFAIFKNKLEFNELSLRDAQFNLIRHQGDRYNNLQFILDFFASEPDTSREEPKPFRLRVQNLRLDDIRFTMVDSVRGQSIMAYIQQGTARIDNLDFPSKVADVRSLNFDGLAFEIQDFESSPLKDDLADTNKMPPQESDTLEVKPFVFAIQEFSLKNGRFKLDNFTHSPGVSTPPEVIDYSHLEVRDIAFDASDVVGSSDLAFEGVLRHLAARERSGFELKHLEAGRVVVNDTLTGLYGMSLQTPYSVLGDTILFRYSAFQAYNDFNDRIRMNIKLKKGSYLRLGDIQYFSQPVKENSFFVNNQNTIVDLKGRVSGRINDLKGDSLEVRMGDRAYARFNFRGDQLAKGSDLLVMYFDFQDLQTDMPSVYRIIPNLNIPKSFERLRDIGFRGNYEIIFGYNHILKGDLRTSIGHGSLDMKLDLTKGSEQATYSGFLQMDQFDLGAWTGNNQLGLTSFNINLGEGSSGLTLPALNANFTGKIDALAFRDYNYRQIDLQGKFQDFVFTGDLSIDDPNVKFDFAGTINLKDSIPVFAFRADVPRLDLGALHFTDKDIILSGTVDYLTVRGRQWSELTGSAGLRDVKILQDREQYHNIDQFYLASGFYPDGRRYFTLDSDIADFALEGRYNLNTAPSNILRMFSRYFPAFVDRLGIAIHDSLPINDNFNLQMSVKNTRSLTSLFSKSLDTLFNVAVNARVDAENGFTELRIDVPHVQYDNIRMYNVGFYWRSFEEQGQYQFFIPASYLNDQKLSSIQLQGNVLEDYLSFNLRSKDTTFLVSNINLEGELTLADSMWQIKFNPSEIELLNQRWYMDEDNFLRFGKQYFYAKNFDLASGNQRITVDTFNNNRGVFVALTNFNVSLLNNFIPSENMKVDGVIYDFEVRIKDMFSMTGIQGFVNSNTLYVNKKPYGVLFGNLEMADLKSPLWARLFLQDPAKHQLRILGAWSPASVPENATFEEIGTIRPGEMQIRLNGTAFPLYVLETFVPGISNTAGAFDATIALSGPPDRLNIDGQVMIREGQLMIDFLKARFHIRNQPVRITNYSISFDKDTIWDAGINENYAVIRGGLSHNRFSDWRINASIRSAGNNFLVMNTTREDSDLYYGYARGNVEADFTGTFEQPNIRINAVTGRGTRLFIPLSTASDVGEVKFIRFVDKNPDTLARQGLSRSTQTGTTGMNLEMNLTVTEDAEVQLIFDEQTGDIIKGRGEGDINLIINREGQFQMFGNYTIRSGEYLFTLLNFVNKPFTVLSGGTINWAGDPYSAQIQLDAIYEETTSIYNFLRDELEVLKNSPQESGLYNQAQGPTNVMVSMHLQGELMKPTITFDMEFPNLAQNLRPLAENRLRVLRQDQSELNRQVFGLIVVGSFLPSNSGFIQNSDLTTAAVNTVTQMLTRQFSNYITSWASEFFGGNGAVSSIDLDIVYNEYRNDVLNNPNLIGLNRDLQVRLTSGFINDRLTLQIGGQFGVGGNSAGAAVNNGLLGGDFVVEIQPTESRVWRLKVYLRGEPDIAGSGRRSRYGFGLNVRKEYDSLQELLQDVGALFKE